MPVLRWFVGLSFVFWLAPFSFAQSFTLQVEHEHTLRNCRGTLIITPEKMAYQTAEKRDAQTWEYREIRQLTVVSPIALELATYEDQKRMIGRDRIFKFRLLAGRITPEISALLLAEATHPLVTSVLPTSAGTPQFTIPVKHLHAVGGCAGMLKIYDDRIVFESQTDARFWRYRDLQNFSHSERFRFELVGYEDKFGGLKAYHFQLKEDLPAQMYDYVWARVYPTKFQRQK
jgi:hypothetical protein